MMISRHITRQVVRNRVAFIGVRSYAAKFGTEYTPGPPKLPKAQQEEFEKLQKKANSQIAIEEYNEQIKQNGAASSTPKEPLSDLDKTFQYFKTVPEFEGDVNPETGEVGGPKQNPTRHGDWSFNGRVTDF